MRRLSTHLIATRREPPADARAPGHGLLVRAGQLQQRAPGVVTVGPLLHRTLRRIKALIRAELDEAGGQEISLAGEQAEAESNGPGRTAGAAAFVAEGVDSHRQLPQLIYQLARARRDEPRPRSGLLHPRESILAVAWIFDVDEDAAGASRERLTAACARVTARCGVDVVRADVASRDGRRVDDQVVALTEAGDDVVAVSDAGPYAAAVATARASLAPPPAPEGDAPMREVATPGATTLAALQAFVPDVPPERAVKTLLYHALLPHGDHQLVAALCRGDRSLDEAKLARACGAAEVGMADTASVEQATGAAVGYAGPVGLPADVRVVADPALADVEAFVCGANRTDAHLRDVRWGRDVALPELADLDAVRDGDSAPDGGTLQLRRGLEVGRVAMLGTGDSEAAGLAAAGPDGRDHPVWTTSCALDVSRLAASVVEQHHDERGIVWPTAIAPHTVVVVTVRAGDEAQERLAATICQDLDAAGVDVVWDDRDDRAGVKFADAELLGFPWRVTCGRDAADGLVELTERGGDTDVVDAGEAVRRVARAARDARVPALS